MVGHPTTARSPSQVRLAVVGLVVVSLLATLTGRLGYLQLVAADTAGTVTSESRLRTVSTPAVRGTILASDGTPLVGNRATLTISVDPLELASQPDAGAAVLQRLARLLGVTPDALRARTTACGAEDAASPPTCYAGSPLVPAPVAEDVDPLVALEVIEAPESYAGVHADAAVERAYPAGVNAAHLLGYLSAATAEEVADGELTGSDLVGRTGLEQAYDGDLRGLPGERMVSVDARGAPLGVVSENAPAAGSSVVTSIHAGLQAVTEQALADAVANARTQAAPDGQSLAADAGAAVVLDVTDGSVLALASYPSYDPSVWVGGVSEAEYAALTGPTTPLVSRATQGELAPASTYKVVSAAAALEAGYGTGPYDCSSNLRVGDRTFENYESRAYGSIDLARALEVSCDTVFYRLAYDLWIAAGGSAAATDAPDPISEMATGWGFGQPTRIDLPGEASGRVADRAWRQAYWEQTRTNTCARATNGYPEVAATDPTRAAYLQAIATENCADGWRLRAGDAVNAAIGQGDTLVTPLQLAVAYAAIANGGTRWQPRVARAVVRPDGAVVRTMKPEAAGTLPVAPTTLDYLRTALQTVTRTGTAATAFAGFPLDTVPIGGKTGSGEVFGSQDTSWFAGFSDRYVVVMVVEQGGTGGATSAPGVRTIFDALYGVHDGVAHPAESIVLAGAPPADLPLVPAAGTVPDAP